MVIPKYNTVYSKGRDKKVEERFVLLSATVEENDKTYVNFMKIGEICHYKVELDEWNEWVKDAKIIKQPKTKCCQSCLKYPADCGNICSGCEAYNEHLY